MFTRIALAGLTAAMSLLAQDPSPPPGGFPIRSLLDQPVAWDDGYRTLLDVWWPDHAAPATGWPAVICAHGGSGSRRERRIRARAIHLASRGYVTIAFDSRGEGVTTALNGPGGSRAFDLHLRDNAEAFPIVAALLPAGTLDLQRLTMTGISGGGRQCFRAAGLSGQPLPTPGTGITHVPVIAAIAPQAAPLDTIGDLVPGANRFSNEMALSLFAQPVNDPQRIAMLAEDYVGLIAALRAETLFDYLPGMQQSGVPRLLIQSFHDAQVLIAPTTAGLPTLRPDVPTKLLWNTGIHAVPDNGIEEAHMNDAVARFFDFHVKGFANGVDVEPEVEIAVAPAEPARYRNFDSAWGHRVLSAWPPAVGTRTLHLDATGSLTAPPPAGPGRAVIAHRVGAGYDLVDYLTDGGTPNTTTGAGKLTPVQRSFDGAPLPRDLEIVGKPAVDLQVSVTCGDFQLNATLFSVPPAGAPIAFAWGNTADRGAAAGVRDLRIEFEDVAWVVPAGHRLRLVLENLPIRRTPAATRYYYAPYFLDVDITVELGAARPARLELPVDETPAASLLPRIGTASVAAGIDHPLRIDAGVARGGSPYIVLIGASGHGPGFDLAGTHVPLNFDAWTGLAAATAGPPPFADFVGVLDANGRAEARFRVPPGPVATSLLGLRFTFACGGVAGGALWAGGPAVLDMLP